MRRLMWFLSEVRLSLDHLSPSQKCQLRTLVIDTIAADPAFRDTLLADLQMLKARQERITHVSAAQDVEDVRCREGVNI